MVQFAKSDRIAGPARSLLLASNSGVTLQGTVLDRGNHPIAGVKISLIQQTSAVAVFSAPNGDYVVNNLKPGAYRVVAAKAGYDTSLKNIQLSPGNNVPVDFRLDQQNSPLVTNLLRRELNRQSAIRGRVLTASGQPIPSATVTLESATAPAVLATTRTNQ